MKQGLLAIVLLVTQTCFSQAIPDSVLKRIPQPILGPNDTIPVPAQVYQDSELIPTQWLEWAWVSAPYPKHLAAKRKEWTRLRNAVYVTYPYARRAGYIINDINSKLAGIKDKSKRKENKDEGKGIEEGIYGST